MTQFFMCINVNVGCLTSGYIGPLVHTIRPFAHKQPGLSLGDCPNGTHWPSNAQAVIKKKRNYFPILSQHYYWCFCEVMFVSYMWRFLLIYISGTSSRSSIWKYTLLVILFYKVMPSFGWVWSKGTVCITGDGYHEDALGINPLEAHAVSSEGCFYSILNISNRFTRLLNSVNYNVPTVDSKCNQYITMVFVC